MATLATHPLSSMPQGSIHIDILKDNVADAQKCSSYELESFGISNLLERCVCAQESAKPVSNCINVISAMAQQPDAGFFMVKLL